MKFFAKNLNNHELKVSYSFIDLFLQYWDYNSFEIYLIFKK